jgi:hypothetical protein
VPLSGISHNWLCNGKSMQTTVWSPTKRFFLIRCYMLLTNRNAVHFVQNILQYLLAGTALKMFLNTVTR